MTTSIDKPTNLQPISSAKTKPFRFVCIRCAQACQSDRDVDARADLNGEPFAAYYCGQCVRAIMPRPYTDDERARDEERERNYPRGPGPVGDDKDRS